MKNSVRAAFAAAGRYDTALRFFERLTGELRLAA